MSWLAFKMKFHSDKGKSVNIELGKSYLMECGLVAKITLYAERDQLPFRGIIRSISQEVAWRQNGKSNDSEKKHPFDLVRELSPEDELTEQTIETFAAITRNGGKVPDGMKRQCRSKVIDEPFVDVMELDILHTCLHYRLVPIEPPKPEMVPLEQADITPGSVFKMKGESEMLPHGVIGSTFVEIRTTRGCVRWSFVELQKWNVSILRPGQTEWSKCEKVKGQ